MNGFCIHANETTILEKTQATRLHDRDRVNKPYFFYSFLCFQKQEFEFVKYHINLLGQKGPRYVPAFWVIIQSCVFTAY